MRRLSGIFFIFLLSQSALPQVAPDKYFVEFTDKNNSPYSIDRPWEFLSQRALDRRAIASISIEINDLPVNPNYVEAVRLIGVDVITRSKWFNGITIYTPNPSLIDQIEQLPFVLNVLKNGPKSLPTQPFDDKFAMEKPWLNPGSSGTPVSLKVADSAEYGLSFTQVHMVKTDLLHNLGFRGYGKVIAVLDAGFQNANSLSPFDSLWQNNQILGTRDFVTPGGNVFVGHPHGMEVLSIMGGYVPGQLIGMAPKASFWLLRSEDTGSEYLIEEYNWVSAAEFADSAGADIINSSLGYTVFDDSTQNHTCADMNGNTTPVTRGANIAFSKGILVVNSAGNGGGNLNFPCVSAPADGTDVLAIAAVDSLGQYASFSSTGQVNGAYVKPNVAAMGKLTVLAIPDGSISRSNGTSFSSPIVAGSAACLWQAYPQYSNATLKMAIEGSGSQYTSPDKYLGYGIPDFFKAFERLLRVNSLKAPGSVSVYPNPFAGDDPLRMNIRLVTGQLLRLELVDITGRKILEKDNIPCAAGENTVSLSGLSGLKPGLYILKIQSQNGTDLHETIKIQRVKR
ncbi:MAG: S8 family serine peptidase [bacterium]